jgi:hemerythrin-like domain-containing protein
MGAGAGAAEALGMTSDWHTHTDHCWWHQEEARWVCSGADTLVDVRDMIVVHTALLREFRLLPGAVARVGTGAVRRAAVVDRHLGLLCDLLHHHHEGEDTLLWPKLRDRLPAAAMAHLDEVEAQHAGLDTALRAVAAARTRWTGDAGAAHRDALVAALDDLYGQLKEHLDTEERAVLPLAASVLTEAEWKAVGEEAVQAMPKPALVLAFGMFAYEGDPAVLRDMLASAPAVPRLLLPRIAPRAYARRARQVHGTPRP